MINSLISNRTPVFAYLMNGIKLQGTIAAQDDKHIVLMGSGLNVLAFKQALATIVPQVAQINVKIKNEDKAEPSTSAVRILDDLIKHKVEVSVYLLSGIRLIGFLEDHDDEQLILNHQDHPQVIFKHAVATIMPNIDKNPRNYGN